MKILRLLRESPDIYIDGTFDAAPLFGQQCQQMLVIMAKSFGYVSIIINYLLTYCNITTYALIMNYNYDYEGISNSFCTYVQKDYSCL